MRDNYGKFADLGAEVVVVAPQKLADAERYAARHPLPFPVLADPARRVFAAYDVQWRLRSLGQRPGLYAIDREGIVRYAFLGTRQDEIPPDADVLAALAELGKAGPA